MVDVCCRSWMFVFCSVGCMFVVVEFVLNVLFAVAVELVVVGVVFVVFVVVVVVVMVDVCSNSNWLIVCCSVGFLLVDWAGATGSVYSKISFFSFSFHQTPCP